MSKIKMIFILLLIALIPSHLFSIMLSSLQNSDNLIKISANTLKAVKNIYISNNSQYPIYSINKNYKNNFNKYKGNLTENIMNYFYEKDNWKKLIPSLNNNGLDGLYIKYKNGIPIDTIVAESKYGTSKLGSTKYGEQMSDLWINKNLSILKKNYSNIIFDSKVNISNYSDIFELPLSNGQKIKVYKIKNNLYIKDLSYKDLVEKSINNHIKFFDNLIENKNYKKRLFNFYFEKNNMVTIKLTDMDSDKSTFYRDKNYKDLSNKFKLNIKNGLLKNDIIELKNNGYSDFQAKKEANNIFEKRLKNNELYKYKKQFIPKISPLISDTLKIGLSSIGISLIQELIISSISNMEFNWNNVLRDSIVETSVFVFSKYIKKASVLKSNLLAVTAMNATDLLFQFTNGEVNFQKILNNAFVSVESLGSILLAEKTINGLFMLVANTFGAASTGVPISTLYGAAATKASLAWLGGGALSAGGGGIALGTALIGGTVFGITVIIPVTYSIIKFIDDKDIQEEKLNDKIDFLKYKYQKL